MTDKLKPCPFCGSENIDVVPRPAIFDTPVLYMRRCVECGAEGPPSTKEFTTNYCNRRAWIPPDDYADAKIGDIVECDDVKLKVVERRDYTNGDCERCYFDADQRCFIVCCNDSAKGISVYFQKVEEEETKMADDKVINIPYHEIGEVFDHDGTKLEVVELEQSNFCASCFYGQHRDSCCDTQCSCAQRKDGKDVAYIEKKEEPKPMEQNETFGPVEACRRLLAGKKIRGTKWFNGEFVWIDKDGGDFLNSKDNIPPNIMLDNRYRYEEYVEPREELDFFEMARRAFAAPDKVFGCDHLMSRIKSVCGVLCYVERRGAGQHLSNLSMDKSLINTKWYEVKCEQ